MARAPRKKYPRTNTFKPVPKSDFNPVKEHGITREQVLLCFAKASLRTVDPESMPEPDDVHADETLPEWYARNAEYHRRMNNLKDDN